MWPFPHVRRVLIFLAALFAVPPAQAAIALVVVPNADTDIDGNAAMFQPFGLTAGDPNCGPGGRFQQIYAAEELPGGNITEIAFRLNFTSDTPAARTYEDITVSLSTSPNGPDSMSESFADNVGPDEAVVFQGDYDYAPGARKGLPPREFDFVIPLDTPFPYDPASGDLLLEVIVPECPAGDGFFQDANLGSDAGGEPGTMSFVYSQVPDAEMGELDEEWGLVTRFIVSSEPPAPESFYRWKDHDVTCSAGDGGSISTGTRVFEYQGLPADAELRRQDRAMGVPIFDVGPSDAPDGSGEETFGSFGAGDLGAFPFVWESERTTLIDGEPVYYSNLVATCHEEGPALVTQVNTPLDGDFTINDGMTASWFDPVFNGEGFNIEVLTAPTFAGKGAPDAPGSAVVYWYAFDAAGFPVWFFGVGFWSGNTLVVPMLFDYDGTGPVFGPGWDPAEFVPTDWGTLVLVFLGCDRGFAAFTALDEATFPSHTFDVERITSVRGITDCAS